MTGYIRMLLPVVDGPNAAALGAWLDDNMPELAADLDGMPYPNKVARLNALTGAGVTPVVRRKLAGRTRMPESGGIPLQGLSACR